MKRILSCLLISSAFFAQNSSAAKDSYYFVNCREIGDSTRTFVKYYPKMVCASTGKPCLIFGFNSLEYWEADRDRIRPITPPPSPFYDPKKAIAWELIPFKSKESYVMTTFPDPFDDSGWWRGHLFRKSDYTKPEMVQISELVCIKP